MDIGELFLNFQDLYHVYVSPDSSRPINLPSEIIKRLSRTSIASVHGKIFNEAKDEIFKLMRDDVFRRFRSSTLFQDLLTHISVHGSSFAKPSRN